MDLHEALDKLLAAHRRYYNINTDTPAAPFDAEALFQFQDMRYFLLKSARISRSDTNEHVFFAKVPYLSAYEFERLEKAAWEEGLSRVEPHGEHKNTDIVLYILTERMESGVAERIRKHRRYKSYKFGLHGFSHFKLIVYDLSDGTIAHNRMGEDRKKVISNTFS